MGIMKPLMWGEKLADFKGENKIFKQQQRESYGGISDAANQSSDFANDLQGYFANQYGEQSETFGMLKGALGRAMSKGPGALGKDWMYGGYGNDPTKNPPGPYQNKWGTGAGVDANGNPIAGGGGGNGGGAGGGGSEAGGGGTGSPFDSLQTMSGYDPSIFQFQPRRFQAREEAAMRGQASEEVTSAYGDAQQAFGQRALQLGQNAPGLLTAGISNIEAERAANEAAAQREVLMKGAQFKREDMRAGIPLKLGQADALQKEAAMQNQIAMQKAAAQQQAMMQARAIAASKANARQAAGAQRYSASLANSRQRALDAEYARRFDAELRLKGAQFQSENFFRSIGALGSLGEMQDPRGYAQLSMGGYGQAGNLYQGPYGTASQGMAATGGSFWGKLAGAALGGALGGASFGAGGFANNVFSKIKF